MKPFNRYMGALTRGLLAVGILLPAAGCEDDIAFVKVFQMDSMAQAIGGPAAAGRPGDYMLENNRLRAVIHGRHNQRSTFPIANGSLVDLDIQRPPGDSLVAQGKDAFYELGPMVNLKLNSSRSMDHGACDKVGSAPCPKPDCVRVTATGPGENAMSLLGLLDEAILRHSYDSAKMVITNDYDVCPDEPFVRVTTTARFEDSPGETIEMEELKKATGLMDILLGENTGMSCDEDKDCPTGETCAKLLLELSFGGLSVKMRRCRKATQKLAGVLSGDLTLFAAKVNIFVPGGGFDHESYIRSVFDAGGDTFSNPLTASFMAAVADGVSYTYFNESGLSNIPVFTSAFTATITNSFACERADKDCFKGKAISFKRFVGVGNGDVASAMEGFYKVRNMPTSRVDGHVIDSRSRKPLSGVDVFAYRMPAKWQSLSSDALAKELKAITPEQLEDLHRKESATTQNPFGEPGIVSHFKTDVGLDNIADGSFGGQLPHHKDWCDTTNCRYILMARPHGSMPSPLIPISVTPDGTVPVTLVTGDHGALQFVVKDQGGQYLPSKLNIGHCFPECAVNDNCPSSRPVCDLDPKDAVAGALADEDRHGICIPSGGYSGASDCRHDQLWDPQQKVCTCPTSGRLPISQGGHLLSDGTVEFFHSSSGKGEVHVEPGSYELLISRGPEYGIWKQFITVRPGMVTRLAATLPRQVDTKGWISGDFHVHGPNSVDASATYTKRLKSMVAEGVELFAATDHDYISDYAPRIHELGLQGWLKSTSGMEVSPLDYGHFIGFPLRYDRTLEQNGGFHWRVSKKAAVTYADEDFENLAPGDIFSALRSFGSLGVEKTVVFVAHFYDYFTNYDMDPWTLKLPFDATTPVGKLYNPVLSQYNFSGEFDALEGFNGKELDILRRPTYKEVRDYNAKLSALFKKSAGWSFERRQQAWRRLSAAAQREFIIRTKDEQKLAIDYTNTNFECRCADDSECGSGAVCDELTGGCVPKAKSSRCTSDTDCNSALVSAATKREECKTISTSITGGTFCMRLPRTCTKDADCTDSFGKDSTGADITETCITATGKCGFDCKKDSQCTKDRLSPVCDTTNEVCIALTAATAADPCPLMRGTVDDWFQMLNRGMVRPFMGNSDTHGTYGTESGIPRNYIKSSTDLPRAIDVAEVADNIKQSKIFPTYGPFVQFTLAGSGMGSTVSLAKGATAVLKLRVQSALWYDVDRIEVYKNGQLIKEIEGKVDCNAGDATCIQSPNRRVVNYDATISDTVDRDSWYVAIVMGVNGRTMAPVYSSKPVARLGMFELIQRLTPLLPPLASFRVPLSPTMSTVRPYALTNPIYVDVDSDGKFTPLVAQPNWATAKDIANIGKSSASSAQTTSQDEGAAKAGHPHDHRNGLGRMRKEAGKFEGLVREGKITPRAISQALNSLRRFSMGSH